MFGRRFLLVTLLSLSCFITNAATFTVTSNADSGPGTLRQALLDAAANGSAEKDYIVFNIVDQSEAGRTIEFPFALPPVSPNIVIDALTQPGPAFGISPARIKIVNAFSDYPNFGDQAFFKGNDSGDLFVSGIYFANKPMHPSSALAIIIKNGGNINISHCLIELGSIDVSDCNSISVKSSLIGYYPDGAYSEVSSIIIANTNSSIIGGSDLEGNALSGYINITNYRSVGSPTYLISNNKIGTDITGTTSSVKIWTQKERIRIQSNFYPVGQSYPPNYTTGQIVNNVIGNIYSQGIYVSGEGKVDIKGNYINTDKTTTANLNLFNPYSVSNQLPTAIYILLNAKAVIGGSNPGDANTIANVANPILEQLASEVVITQNSIFCSRNPNSSEMNLHDFFGVNDLSKVPSVKITSITNTGASGTATLGARVELFYDSKDGTCTSCSPRNYITSVTADNQGNWAYTGVTPTSLIASAIYNNQTSCFTTPKVDITQLTVKQPHCGAGGEITGIQFYNAAVAQWVDQNNTSISSDLDIKNLPPGKYKLKVGSANCGIESDWITLLDDQPKIDAAQITATPPACNNPGSITGVKATAGAGEALKYSWKDENQIEKGTSLNVSGLPLGKYTLTVTGAVNGCTAVYGPVELTNSNLIGVSQTNSVAAPTPCGQNLGSITGIQVTGGTGTLKYSWKNAAGTQVAITKDLTNQPGGTYTLSVTDDTSCGAVSTSPITIPETNSITLNDNGVITQPDCNGTTGAIKGITVTGATLYQWTRTGASTSVTTASPELLNAQPGAYHLVASNASGCSKTSQEYVIRPAANNETYGGITKTLVDATCGLNNGSIVAVFQDATTVKPKSVRWVQQSTGQTVGNSMTLSGIDAGNYDLYATAQNGCERFLITYTIGRKTIFQTSTATVNIKDEECGQANGSITGISITQANAPLYTWTNAAGQVVASTLNLTNKVAGTYTLKIQDGACQQTLPAFTIGTSNAVIPPPLVANMQLCSGGDALISVTNPSAQYGYRLYDVAFSAVPIATQASGKFNVKISAARSYYISKYIGNCESDRAEIKISVGIANVSIANTFTPNGDGINDTWKINSIENYPNALVQLFNRHGDKIFESRGYSKQFDGTYQGQDLPIGTYYYIINLNTGCNLLTGSLTLVR